MALSQETQTAAIPLPETRAPATRIPATGVPSILIDSDAGLAPYQGRSCLAVDGDLIVRNNPNRPQASAADLADVVIIGGAVGIYGNAP